MYKAPQMSTIESVALRFCDEAGCVAICFGSPAREEESVEKV